MNKFFKSKKKVSLPPPPPEPRSIEELQKQHNELCARAGALQYRIEVEKQELLEVNKVLSNINNEAAARNKLDAESKPEATEEAK